ncbi:amidohydrolase family protein [bacterium]|nr:amidohydrolase family protein [bacterium]
MPAPSLERRVRAAERGLELARTLGVTSIQDDASYDDRLEPGRVYGDLLARGRLTARVTLWQRLGRDLGEVRSERAALPKERGASRLSYGLLKGYLDGSLGSRTALLDAPYCDAREAGTGIPLIDADVLRDQVREAHEGGFQVGLHAIGDRATALALDAFADLARTGSPEVARAARHRVEHVQVVRGEDIARFAVLGAVASVQPIHLANDMKIARERLGERTKTSYPWRSLLDSGAALAFGTDYPVEPLDPLPGIFCAVSRRDPRAPLEAYHPEQRLTREEALSAYTAGSAFAAHGELFLGRLVPGFLADVCVLSRDLFAISHEEIPEVRCDLTILDGEVVFERSPRS